MSQIICITNLKGGSGKTTISINLSASLAIAEKRTLLIDCDPKGNATIGSGVPLNSSKSLYQAMINKEITEDQIVDTELDYLKIIPSCFELYKFEQYVSGQQGFENTLSVSIDKIKDSFDYLIIDTPPSLNMLTINSLVAANGCIIPMTSDFFALNTLKTILHSIQFIKNKYNPNLELYGILLTMISRSFENDNLIKTEMNRIFKNSMFESIIPLDMTIKDSTLYGTPIALRDIHASGSVHFLRLAEELLSKYY